MKIGFLISEYPGQTHSFFWREMSALNRLYEADFKVIGTRPNAQPARHAWLDKAPADYLWPVPGTAWLWLALALPLALMRCLRHPGNAARLCRPQGWQALLLAIRLWHCARANGIEHLHVHSLANSALIAAFCKQIYGLPYSVTLHGPLAYFGDNQPVKWEQADFAIVITETLRRAVEAAMPQVAHKISVAPMGVDTDYFAPPATEGTASATGTPFRWFSCGRLVPGKGFDTIIRAVAHLRAHQPDLDFSLRIAGEDAQGGQGFRLELQRQIDAADLSEVITLLGSLPQQDIRAELHAASGFVLISNEEALGVVYMEAMACGLPTIGADTGGVAELIHHGEDGFLVLPGDDATLAPLMAQVMTDPALRDSLAAAARQKVMDHFSSDRSAHALAAALKLRKRTGTET